MIRVLLVDDDPLVRSGLRLMLSGADDIEVVAEAADGGEVPDLVDEHAPDLVLMDIRMPGVDGLKATELLRARPGAPAVVMLTTFKDDEQVLGALRAGAAGFLLKHTPPAEIVAAVRRVKAGEPVLSPAVTEQLIARVTQGGDTTGPRRPETAEARLRLDRLGDREREVAVAVGRGRTNAEIAAELYMSVATVKAHVSHILTKLEHTNRVQIALTVHYAGLV
ncbi:response regulator transcription factor [Streptomyces sp. NBC_01288]|uniref:response regulator transcription factor n=1 Tax=Streptomyces sp. NBC_01288 TaxID=2903814 RepID=UPI002E13513C|nr:response regulator transcription factor [Streptomyces sp. NBC_01288]